MDTGRINDFENLNFIGNYVPSEYPYRPFFKKVSIERSYSQKCSKNKNNNISNFNNNLLFFNQKTDPCVYVEPAANICDYSSEEWVQYLLNIEYFS